MAGVLHDVIDDTCESLHKIEEEFGDDVAKLVAGVSKLSYINQVFLTGYDNKPISFGSKWKYLTPSRIRIVLTTHDSKQKLSIGVCKGYSEREKITLIILEYYY